VILSRDLRDARVNLGRIEPYRRTYAKRPPKAPAPLDGRYLTLLQAEPEPGTAAHICWIGLMSDAFDVLSPLERDAAVGWMASQTEGARQ